MDFPEVLGASSPHIRDELLTGELPASLAAQCRDALRPYDRHQMVSQAHALLNLGFALVRLEYGQKHTRKKGWNHPDQLIRTPEQATYAWARAGNIGVHLGASGILSLDIDDLSLARAEFAAQGMDLDALVRAHPCAVQGRGVKLWYRLEGEQRAQFGATRACKVENRTAFELRSGHGHQDVAPGSLHPLGMTYTWLGRAACVRADLPQVPSELVRMYAALDRPKSKAASRIPFCASRRETQATGRRNASGPGTSGAQGDHPSVIEAFKARWSVAEILTRNGFVRVFDRFLSPDSQTGAAGVVIFDEGEAGERAFSHHAGAWPGAQDAFGLYAHLEHGGDLRAAVRSAAAELGVQALPRSREAFLAQHAPSIEGVKAAYAEALPQLLLQLGARVRELSLHRAAAEALVLFGARLLMMATESLTLWRGHYVIPAAMGKVQALAMNMHPTSFQARSRLLEDLGLIRRVKMFDSPSSPWVCVLDPEPQSLVLRELGAVTLDTHAARITRARHRTDHPSAGLSFGVVGERTEHEQDAQQMTAEPSAQPSAQRPSQRPSQRRVNPLRPLMSTVLALQARPELGLGAKLARQLGVPARLAAQRLEKLRELGYLSDSGKLLVTLVDFLRDLRAEGALMARDALMRLLTRRVAYLSAKVSGEGEGELQDVRALESAQHKLTRLLDGESPHAVGLWLS